MKSRRGFTLVETLVALILVTSVALPASLWFYRSRMNQAALERFRALQVLEMHMNRAVLGRVDKHHFESLALGRLSQLEIRHTQMEQEHHLVGRVLDLKGKEIVSLDAVWFDRGQP